jgi:hypothetical protein
MYLTVPFLSPRLRLFRSVLFFLSSNYSYTPYLLSLADQMSLKAELDIWASALQAYDQEDFQKSLGLFSVRERLSIIILSYSLIHSSVSPIPPRFSLTWDSSTLPSENTRPRSSVLSKPPTWTSILQSRESQHAFYRLPSLNSSP